MIIRIVATARDEKTLKPLCLPQFVIITGPDDQKATERGAVMLVDNLYIALAGTADTEQEGK